MTILRRRDQQFEYTTHSFYQPEKSKNIVNSSKKIGPTAMRAANAKKKKKVSKKFTAAVQHDP
jgi:hypothetical protein